MNDTASGKTLHNGVLKTADQSDGLSNPREHHDRLDCEKRRYHTNLRFAPVETEEIGEIRALWRQQNATCDFRAHSCEQEK
jgi:hypothetical protein